MNPFAAQVAEQLHHRLVGHLGVGPIESRMRRARKPFVDDALELVGDHPGVRCHDQLEQAFHASCRQRLLVVFEHGLKRLGGAPLRMLRSERLDTVQGERELDVEWLLIPERPIVVEDGNPRRRRNEVGTLLDRLPPRRTPEYSVSPHHRSRTAADRPGLRWLQPRFPSTRQIEMQRRTSVGRNQTPCARQAPAALTLIRPVADCATGATVAPSRRGWPLRVNQVVGAFGGLGDRELYALDPAVERVAVRPVVGRDRSAGVLADIAAVVSREDVRQRRVDVALSHLLAVGVERDRATFAQASRRRRRTPSGPGARRQESGWSLRP